MAVGAEAEVLHGLTSVLGSTEEESVGTGGGTESQLVEGQDLTTSLLNAGSGSRGEAQGSHGQLGDGQEAVVIGDGSDHDDGLALVGLGHVRGDARERNRGTVDPRHKETTQNDLVEVRLRAAYPTPH